MGLAVVFAAGVATHPLALALVLMLSAPSVSGSPSFTALMGHDPAPPMRLLILGTALFPLTALPALWLMPGLGDTGEALAAAARLLLVILLAVSAGFVARAMFLPEPDAKATRAIDGASAILLAIVVVGLMAALSPALKSAPLNVLYWLAAVLVANFGLQTAAYFLGAQPGNAIVAGNRNIALYLVALPPGTAEPLLIFIGCYQIPMYLTPIVMARVFRPPST